MHFPKTAGGLIGLVITAIIISTIGLFVINRVTFLQTLVAKKAA